MAQLQAFDNRLPSQIDMKSADQLRRVLASQIEEGGESGAKIRFAESDGGQADVILSPALAETFLTILRLISAGKGFQVLPYSAELTTQQAADLLNVSRPFLIKLLESGEIAYQLVGRHRRVRAEDLFAYKATRDADRAEALGELIQSDSKNDLI